MSSKGPRTFSRSARQLSMHISSYDSQWYLFLTSVVKYLCAHILYEHTVFPKMVYTQLTFHCENPLAIEFL